MFPSSSPTRLLTRYLRPLALLLVLYDFGIAYQYLRWDRWPEDPYADFAGYCALVAGTVLLYGWLANSHKVYTWGLAGSAAVTFGRALMTGTEMGWDDPGVIFSTAVFAGAFAAWFIEKTEHKWRYEWQG